MKRKLFAVILLFSVLYTFGVGVAALEKRDICKNARHVFAGVRYVPATDEMDGLDVYRCRLCGWEYEVVLPCTGHRWSEWAVIKAPTCTKTGYRYRACHLHGLHVDSETIPALGHDYRLSKESMTSCLNDGIDTYSCSRCGDSYSNIVVSALGHNYEIVGTTATCESEGVSLYSCLRCGDSYEEPVPALEHNYISVITVKATCTTDGEMTFTCSCNNSEKYIEVIAATGHDFGGVAACKNCGMHEEQGIQQMFAFHAPDTAKLPLNVLDAMYTFVAVFGIVAFASCFMVIHRVNKLW